MNKAKKFLVGLLAFASVSAFALGMVACGEDSTDAGTLPPEGQNAIEQVYDSYVEYATAQGQTPLDYETWLATIKGATGAQGPQGVGIESVEVDEDGMMVITLTNGTVLPAIELPTGEPIEKGATRNLHYQKISGKEEYRVIGLGLASEQDIVISSTYNGLPVTEIGNNAFENETYITSVEIPDSVTTIGYHAFYSCYGLTSVTIPDSVTTIGSGAFATARPLYNLESVYYTGDIASWCAIDFSNGGALCWPADLYINNEKVVDLVIPNGVKKINDYAFYNANFESVTIPDSVTAIGDSAFDNCHELTNVYYTGDIASWCAIEFGSNLLDDGMDLYINNQLVAGDLVIPDGVETISDYAFAYCDSLTSVTIGNAVTTIGEYAFAYCDSLTSVTIPDSVTTIGDWAFYGCSSLTSITIPDSVTTIGNSAFAYCDSLTSVIFIDTSTWYITSNNEDWQNKTNGTQVDVSDAETAAFLLHDFYKYDYWYKL